MYKILFLIIVLILQVEINAMGHSLLLHKQTKKLFTQCFYSTKVNSATWGLIKKIKKESLPSLTEKYPQLHSISNNTLKSIENALQEVDGQSIAFKRIFCKMHSHQVAINARNEVNAAFNNLVENQQISNNALTQEKLNVLYGDINKVFDDYEDILNKE